MSKCVSVVRAILKIFDLFPTSQFLRYKQDADYKTATGGLVSIALIVICIIMFYSLGMQTANRQIINGSTSYEIDVEPLPLTIEFQKGSDFMFGVGIMGLNLNDPNVQYFNVTLKQNYYSPLLKPINSTVVPLVQCTPDHFSYSEDIERLYHQFNISEVLCPPLNYEFIVLGRPTSAVYSEIAVYLSRCDPAVNPKCISSANLANIQAMMGGFTLMVPVISTIVNPGNEIYKQVYLQDQNYNFFTTTQGLWMNGQIQQYQIDTDNSLMPYTDIQTEYITAIPSLLATKTKLVSNNIYAEVTFTKSSTTTSYTRSFNKVDDYFSYVGGLLGTTLVFFFILSSYSEKAYVMSIASELFALSEDAGPSPKFNMFYYFSIFIKKAVNFVRKDVVWAKSDLFLESLEEMEKQLSIEYLLNRINYFEEAISSILNENQLEVLYLNEKKTMAAGRAVRKKYTLPKFASVENLKIIGNRAKESTHNIINFNSPESNVSKVSINFEELPKVPLELSSNSSISQNYQQEAQSKLKGNLLQVINESNSGNPISRRILSKVDRKVFPQIEVSLIHPRKKSSDEYNDQFQIQNDPEMRQPKDSFQFQNVS